jgi:transcriptional regulator with XRE-family HTH domain
MMDTTTSAGKLIVTLRNQMRIRGLHYHDVASRLKVSEGTVKRYFSGKGLSLSVLERLAEIVDLDLLSLATLAQQQTLTAGGLTREQQVALTRHQPALSVLYNLGIGFTPAQIVEEFDLADEMETILDRLEAMGLIRRYANNSVKVLRRPKFGGETDGPIREHKIATARKFLSEFNLSGDDVSWTFYGARLSADSAIRMRQLIHRFASDIETLTKIDIGTPMRETQWYRLFVGAQPTSRKKLLSQP